MLGLLGGHAEDMKMIRDGDAIWIFMDGFDKGLVVTDLAENDFTKRDIDKSDTHRGSDSACLSESTYDVLLVTESQYGRRRSIAGLCDPTPSWAV